MDPNFESNNETIAMEIDDTTENPTAEPVIPSPHIETRVIKQLEYYFSDVNLPYDKFLRNLTKVNDGWVQISILMTFKRLSNISNDKAVVISAVKNASSTLLEFDEINEKIRRKPFHVLPVVDKKLLDEMIERSVYCKRFPKTATMDELLEFAATFGDNTIEKVIPRKYKNQQFKGSVYFLFKTKVQANIFMEQESVIYKGIELERMWEKYYLERKKIQYANILAKTKMRERAVIEKYFQFGFLMKAEYGEQNLTVNSIKRLCSSLDWPVTYVRMVEEQKLVWIRLETVTSAKDLLEKMDDKINTLKILFSVPEEEEEHKLLYEMAMQMKNAVDTRKSTQKFKRNRNRN